MILFSLHTIMPASTRLFTFVSSVMRLA